MERFHVAEPAAGQACPFCAQDLGGSPLIGHYRAYFSYAYTELKTAVAEELATVERLHGGEAAAGFERAVRVCGERRQFWARFCDMPAVDRSEERRVGKACVRTCSSRGRPYQ